MNTLNTIISMLSFLLTLSLSAQPIHVGNSTTGGPKKLAYSCNNIGNKECNEKIAEISIINISTTPNSNQTLIEFEVMNSKATLSIDAYSITQLGDRKNLIAKQKFDIGIHRLLFDNAQILNGISQIIVTNGKQVYTGKTIRL